MQYIQMTSMSKGLCSQGVCLAQGALGGPCGTRVLRLPRSKESQPLCTLLQHRGQWLLGPLQASAWSRGLPLQGRLRTHSYRLTGMHPTLLRETAGGIT